MACMVPRISKPLFCMGTGKEIVTSILPVDNKSLKTGVFPSDWKRCNVTPFQWLVRLIVAELDCCKVVGESFSSAVHRALYR